MLRDRPGGSRKRRLQEVLAENTNVATRRREGAMEDHTFKRIRSIIVNHFDIDPAEVSLMASFVDDLGSTSLDAIELVMAFEDAFDVMIPDSAVETIVTIQDAVDCIERRKRLRQPDRPGP